MSVTLNLNILRLPCMQSLHTWQSGAVILCLTLPVPIFSKIESRSPALCPFLCPVPPPPSAKGMSSICLDKDLL